MSDEGIEEMEAIAEEMKEEQEEILKRLDPYHGPNAVTGPTRDAGGPSANA
ncbi:MAG TPA: hypothetical protein VFW71_14685 [Actinomycetota bacterium]|nr:hypothetical protein [Actinomycetota bacterium]